MCDHEPPAYAADPGAKFKSNKLLDLSATMRRPEDSADPAGTATKNIRALWMCQYFVILARCKYFTNWRKVACYGKLTSRAPSQAGCWAGFALHFGAKTVF